MRSPVAVVISTLVLVLWLATSGCARTPAPTIAVRPAATATALPLLSVTLVTGAPWSPATARGKVLLIDVWASWCAPCRAGLRRAEALAVADPDLAVIGLSLDEDDAAVRAFLADVQVGFAIARVDAAVLSAAPLGITTLPALILVDADGRIRWVGQDLDEGAYDAVAAAIAQLHAERSAPTRRPDR